MGSRVPDTQAAADRAALQQTCLLGEAPLNSTVCGCQPEGDSRGGSPGLASEGVTLALPVLFLATPPPWGCLEGGAVPGGGLWAPTLPCQELPPKPGGAQGPHPLRGALWVHKGARQWATPRQSLQPGSLCSRVLAAGSPGRRWGAMEIRAA